MNCANCGAAMRWLERHGYASCEYCTTFVFPDRAPALADPVEALASAGRHACPRCDQPLSAAEVARRPAQFCDRCRGTLVSHEHFGDVVQQLRHDYGGAPDAPTPLEADELRRARTCPGCRRRMETHPYYGPGSVVIDTCAACRLIWLDAGELGAIQRAPGVR